MADFKPNESSQRQMPQSANQSGPKAPVAAPSTLGKTSEADDNRHKAYHTVVEEMVKYFEGFYAKAYLCPANKWTIGYGSIRINGRAVKPSDSVTKAQAEEMLKNELASHTASVDRLVKVPINALQRAALISFTYNLGSGNLSSSTLLKKLNKGDYEGAANEFKRWRKGDGKVLGGLVKRRFVEEDIFRGNSAPNMDKAPTERNLNEDFQTVKARAYGLPAGAAKPAENTDAKPADSGEKHSQPVPAKEAPTQEEAKQAQENAQSLPEGSVTPHFKWAEFACKDGTAVPQKYRNNLRDLCAQLEVLRTAMGASSITVNSGYRSPSYNKRIGGASKSQHLLGTAADFNVNVNGSRVKPSTVRAKIEELIKAGKMKEGGLGKYNNFVHYDVRSSGHARWSG